jgi:hypothetical protein
MMRKLRYSGLFMLISIAYAGHTQVSNNNMDGRIELELDAGWTNSTTKQATVQWNCINKMLTNKCLIYHNDQWFYIVPEQSGKYFINLSVDHCRDGRGIQVTVIEGNPCEISTYQIVHCIPQLKNDNAFVTLDSVKAGVSYLINIDGFLGDFCDFKIEFGTRARGIPYRPVDQEIIESQIQARDSIVSVSWRIPDTLTHHPSHFLIYRKHDLERSGSLWMTVPLQRNTLGVAEARYQVMDTLRQQGRYQYSFYGNVLGEEPVLMGEESIVYKKEIDPGRAEPYTVMFPLYCPKSGKVRVDVYHSVTEKFLGSHLKKVNKGNANIALDLSAHTNKGVYFFKIIVTGEGIKEERYFSFKPGQKN